MCGGAKPPFWPADERPLGTGQPAPHAARWQGLARDATQHYQHSATQQWQRERGAMPWVIAGVPREEGTRDGRPGSGVRHRARACARVRLRHPLLVSRLVED